VHNVSNALAAAAVAWGLGIPAGAIIEALRTFGAPLTDNRGWVRHVKLPSGVGVLLDFGHNPAGLRHLFALGRSLLGPDGRVLLVATQPGDRTEQDFLALAKEIAAVLPRHVFLWESEPYMRGREPGEIARDLARALVAAGVSSEVICAAAGEVEGLERAILAARPGDLVIVAPEIDRDAVMMALQGRGAA
jgi:UDP-N-acetylmuramyl tripeptide synthase